LSNTKYTFYQPYCIITKNPESAFPSPAIGGPKFDKRKIVIPPPKGYTKGENERIFCHRLEQLPPARLKVNLRSKKIWLVLALLAVVAAGAAMTWLASSREPAQFVTLSDGRKYRFVAVTWGTNHSDPTDQRFVARLVNHLPTRIADYFRGKFGVRLKLRPTFRISVPSLCLWLKPETAPDTAGNPPVGRVTYVYAMLADGNGVEAGSESTQDLSANFTSPVAIFPMVVPRRSKILECHFYAHSFGTGGGPAIPVPLPELGRIRFANPLYGRYPQWQPETLPATRVVGDLEVHLSNCISGITVWLGRDALTGKNTNIYRAPVPGEEAVTRFDLQVVSPRGTNERWTSQITELSDATGNGLTNSQFVYQQGTFWPDEQALRLHVELKRFSGFPPSDLIIFTNLPLPAPNVANGAALTNTAHGIPIVVRNFSTEQSAAKPGMISFRSGEPTGPYWVEVEIPVPLAGEAVDFVKTATDAGETVDYQSGNDSGQFRRRSFRSLPANAKSLNVTVAIQKLRTVDFFVKPVVAK
jgi:hypothetical protein